MEILIDTREQTPYIFKNIESVHATLDTGDYTLRGYEDIVRVERKATVAEFAKNITENRFWNEMDRLRDFPQRFILCEFSFNAVLQYPVGSSIPKSRWKYIKVRPAFIVSKIAELEVDYGIPVLLAGSRENAKFLLSALFKRCII